MHTLQNPLALLSRLLLAALFLPAGIGKITGFAGTAGYIASVGLPMPTVAAAVAIAVEVLGGLALIVGFGTRWAALALALTLFFLNQEDHSAMPALLFGGTIALIPTAVARLIMLLLWVPTSHQMIALDLWLSERLLPRRLNPHGEWLVLRHAVPQLAMLAVFAALLGPLGMAGYSGFILIGLLHDKRIGHLDPGFSERHPYLTALHWSHWSPSMYPTACGSSRQTRHRPSQARRARALRQEWHRHPVAS